MEKIVFHGVIPPVITPLTEDFEVDVPSLERVIERLITAGVDGLFVLGSTGEVAFLDARQRATVLEVAVHLSGGRLPVLAGIVDTSTDRCIGHGRMAERAGADAAVLTAPFYTRTSQPEIAEHFRQVHAALALPLVAYDLPVSVHSKLERETVMELADDQVIAGLKDSSGDEPNFRGVLLGTRALQGFSVLTGSELTADAALLMGAHGLVPGLANVDPWGYVRLQRAAERGNWVVARAEQERLYQLFAITAVGRPRTSPGAAGIGGFKTALQLLGVIQTNLTARPQRRLDAGEVRSVELILTRHGLQAA
jgi:4-hydroxy-tetrahydrodipicolinate synthase